MLTKKLELAFLSVVLLGTGFLASNLYEDYRFKKEPISNEIQARIDAKEDEVVRLMQEHYGHSFRVPLVVKDDMPSNLYGLAIMDENGHISININKKRIRESLDLILSDTVPHEYAHAYMFSQGKLDRENGHSKEWQEVCLILGGSRCDRFVNHDDVALGKMKLGGLL